MGETTWINYLPGPQQLVSWSQIFWTINSQVPTRPTCAWQLKGSVTVGKERCGALTNTGTCIFWGVGGGDIEDMPVLRVVDIWYECMNASVDGRIIFVEEICVFSGCYHFFGLKNWRTTYKPMHVACYLSEFQKLFLQVGPSCFRGVLSWQSLVSFYLAMV